MSTAKLRALRAELDQLQHEQNDYEDDHRNHDAEEEEAAAAAAAAAASSPAGSNLSLAPSSSAASVSGKKQLNATQRSSFEEAMRRQAVVNMRRVQITSETFDHVHRMFDSPPNIAIEADFWGDISGTQSRGGSLHGAGGIEERLRQEQQQQKPRSSLAGGPGLVSQQEPGSMHRTQSGISFSSNLVSQFAASGAGTSSIDTTTAAAREQQMRLAVWTKEGSSLQSQLQSIEQSNAALSLREYRRTRPRVIGGDSNDAIGQPNSALDTSLEANKTMQTPYHYSSKTAETPGQVQSSSLLHKSPQKQQQQQHQHHYPHQTPSGLPSPATASAFRDQTPEQHDPVTDTLEEATTENILRGPHLSRYNDPVLELKANKRLAELMQREAQERQVSYRRSIGSSNVDELMAVEPSMRARRGVKAAAAGAGGGSSANSSDSGTNIPRVILDDARSNQKSSYRRELATQSGISLVDLAESVLHKSLHEQERNVDDGNDDDAILSMSDEKNTATAATTTTSAAALRDGQRAAAHAVLLVKHQARLEATRHSIRAELDRCAGLISSLSATADQAQQARARLQMNLAGQVQRMGRGYLARLSLLHPAAVLSMMPTAQKVVLLAAESGLRRREKQLETSHQLNLDDAAELPDDHESKKQQQPPLSRPSSGVKTVPIVVSSSGTPQRQQQQQQHSTPERSPFGTLPMDLCSSSGDNNINNNNSGGNGHGISPVQVRGVSPQQPFLGDEITLAVSTGGGSDDAAAASSSSGGGGRFTPAPAAPARVSEEDELRGLLSQRNKLRKLVLENDDKSGVTNEQQQQQQQHNTPMSDTRRSGFDSSAGPRTPPLPRSDNRTPPHGRNTPQGFAGVRESSSSLNATGASSTPLQKSNNNNSNNNNMSPTPTTTINSEADLLQSLVETQDRMIQLLSARHAAGIKTVRVLHNQKVHSRQAERAATTIQACWRMFSARSAFLDGLLYGSGQEDEELVLVAVETIQRCWRGMRARQLRDRRIKLFGRCGPSSSSSSSSSQPRIKEAAVAALQRMWLCYRARRILHRLRMHRASGESEQVRLDAANIMIRFLRLLWCKRLLQEKVVHRIMDTTWSTSANEQEESAAVRMIAHKWREGAKHARALRKRQDDQDAIAELRESESQLFEREFAARKIQDFAGNCMLRAATRKVVSGEIPPNFAATVPKSRRDSLAQMMDAKEKQMSQ